MTTTALIHHLWQSTLFVLAAWLLTLVLRNNAARVRYAIWFVASLKFLVPFSVLTALGRTLSWRTASPAPSTDGFITMAQQLAEPLASPAMAPAQATLTVDALPIVLGVWALGTTAFAINWLVAWLRIRALARAATASAIDAPIPVKISKSLIEPGVIGIVRPVLLLPEGIASRLTPYELQAVLSHELCHVRRRDNLTAAIHMLVAGIFWFHPFVWWIGARLIDERERACDESAVELGSERQGYAESILKVCRYYLEAKIPCVAGTSGGDLKERVRAIMRMRGIPRLSHAKKALLATAAAFATALPIAIGLLATPPSIVSAQALVASTVAFDAATVNVAAPGDWYSRNVDDNRFSARATLRMLIADAYGVDELRVYGSELPLDRPTYEIEATMSTPGQHEAMLQSLLADRFDLKVHRERRQVTQWVLRIAEGGHKLQRISPKHIVQIPVAAPLAGYTHRVNAQLGNLHRYLQNRLGSPVINQTGLSEGYDVSFDAPSSNEALLNVLTEQLGLKLEQEVGPLDVIVVDEIGRLQAAGR